MPGKHYDDAFAMLEKSFNDSSFMKAYQSLPAKKGQDPKISRPNMVNFPTSTTSTTSTINDDNSYKNKNHDSNYDHGEDYHDDDDDDDFDDDDTSDGSMHEGYGKKINPLIALNLACNNSGLPPTPPTLSRDQFRDTAHTAPLPQKAKSDVTTPVLQQGPPTPGLTPPNTRNRSLEPPRPQMPRFPSSVAQSFVTAREGSSPSSAYNSQLSLSLAEGPAGKSWLDATKSLVLGGVGLGASESDEEEEEEEEEAEEEAEDYEDGDITPTGRRSFATMNEQESFATLKANQGYASLEECESYAFLHEQEKAAVTPETSVQDLSETGDTNFLRNVTVRRKRSRPHTNNQDKSAQPNGQPLRESLALKHDESTSTSKDEDTVHASEADRKVSAAGHDKMEVSEWPAADNDMLYNAIRDEKSKRLSDVSQTSATVEARVIAGPRQKKRILRHAGRNLALRDDVSSARTSLDSVGGLGTTCPLRHNKAHLSDSRDKVGDDDMKHDKRSVSNPERQRADKMQVIVIPERRASLAAVQSTQIDGHDETPLLTPRQHQLHHSKPNVARQRPISGTSSQGGGDEASSPRKVSHDAKRRTSLSRKAENSTPPRELSGELSEGGPNRRRHVSAPLPSNRSLQQPANNAARRTSEKPAMLPVSPEPSARDLDHASPETEQVPSSPSLDYHTAFATLENTAVKQSNLATSTLFDQLPTSPRRSLDQSHANARYLHASETPGALSQISDRTDMIDINEAQAVTLYPHGNNSLLLVQHVSSQPTSKALGLDTAQRPPAIDEVSTPTDSDGTPTVRRPLQPIFTAVVDGPQRVPAPAWPGVLPGLSDESRAESLFQEMPATAMPPVIIIPPTPIPNSSSHNSASATPVPQPTQLARPAAPERRQSLVQRARRYSESFMQPFLPVKTNRSVSSRVTDRERPKSAHERDHTLHPFWRPRGFWDDFSDSDSELDDYEYEYRYSNPYDADDDAKRGGTDKLPAGGDTSDVASLPGQQKGGKGGLKWPRKMSVRMPGFMGSGGFLVGNTLGIDRHGTNNRRPYVFLPRSMTLSKRGPAVDRKCLASSRDRPQNHRRTQSSPPISLPFFSNAPSSRVNKQTAPSPAMRKKRSQDLLKNSTKSAESIRRAPRQRNSQRNLLRTSAGANRGFVFGNLQVQVLSLTEIREKMEQRRFEKEERKMEAKRKALRGLISAPVPVDLGGL